MSKKTKVIIKTDSKGATTEHTIDDLDKGSKIRWGRMDLKQFQADDSNPYIPVFDEMFVEDERLMENLAYSVQQRKNIMIVGPTGCGKSTAGRYICSLANAPLRIFNCNGESTTDALIGKYVLQQVVVHAHTGEKLTNKEKADPKIPKRVATDLKWIDGAAIEAYRNGYILMLEEIDSANPRITFALHSLLQTDTDRIYLADKDNELVMKHPNFMVIATGNTTGKGDDTHHYTGTQIMNEAFLDRFEVVIQTQYMKPEAEAQIIQQKSGLNITVCKKMVAAANDIRRAIEANTLNCSMSTRKLLAWADFACSIMLCNKKKPKEAKPEEVAEFCENTMLSRLSGQDKASVKKIVEARLGEWKLANSEESIDDILHNAISLDD